MGSIVLPYMETQPKLIFFTDFDGTITVEDSQCWSNGSLRTHADHRRQ